MPAQGAQGSGRMAEEGAVHTQPQQVLLASSSLSQVAKVETGL